MKDLFYSVHHATKTFIPSNTSPQVEKKAKKGMTDINLRSVAAVTSCGGGLTMLQNMCANFDFPPPITEQPYQQYLKHILEKNPPQNAKEAC